MKVLKGKVAVITGAASGIGRSLALQLAREGCNLSITDINSEGLRETAEMAANNAVKIATEVVNAADRDHVYAFAENVVSQHGCVDIVINNAGVSLRGTIEEVSDEEFEWLMGINFWGVVYGSKAFLPYLKQQSEANLVNISSVHGLFTNPGVGPYCSSKFGIRGFTMALCQELKDTSVKVSCVHPGGIKTNIVKNSRDAAASIPEKSLEEAQEDFDKTIARISADKAAKIIIRGIRKDKARILVGSDATVFDFMTRYFPSYWQKFMGVLPDLLSRLGSK
ncbi:MAG: SDR family NAD(P)-dependent oxidoreductase [Deltaproteobacteria bacterium]|nr:SDR family NAD(P)-dependent oxidoreductase [Deltaproteobacteria bacterium]MBW1983825.1 SDR family NAD(P)-dependent oxidoreductase [Deltaproteobacteria bacterium]